MKKYLLIIATMLVMAASTFAAEPELNQYHTIQHSYSSYGTSLDSNEYGYKMEVNEFSKIIGLRMFNLNYPGPVGCTRGIVRNGENYNEIIYEETDLNITDREIRFSQEVDVSNYNYVVVSCDNNGSAYNRYWSQTTSFPNGDDKINFLCTFYENQYGFGCTTSWNSNIESIITNDYYPPPVMPDVEYTTHTIDHSYNSFGTFTGSYEHGFKIQVNKYSKIIGLRMFNNNYPGPIGCSHAMLRDENYNLIAEGWNTFGREIFFDEEIDVSDNEYVYISCDNNNHNFLNFYTTTAQYPNSDERITFVCSFYENQNGYGCGSHNTWNIDSVLTVDYQPPKPPRFIRYQIHDAIEGGLVW